ncbi:MAG: ribosome-associated translation inhibitor RaiA [Verrucomicrobiales bacterium]|nr:ribosome-associated translation inhibitor RaiA [Verrucomicrobiales bacterium]
MQVANVNLPITVTGRHVSVTEAMREYAQKKVEGLHLDYPKIIEAKVLLDVEGYRHIAEIVLHCANHITIEADTETSDMYASIDETISKIARRMRKHKTRMLKSHRPKRGETKLLHETVYSQNFPEDEKEEVVPLIIHEEKYPIRNLFPEEAIMDMELSERNFVVFTNAGNGHLSVLFRRKDGDYGVIEPQSAPRAEA